MQWLSCLLQRKFVMLFFKNNFSETNEHIVNDYLLNKTGLNCRFWVHKLIEDFFEKKLNNSNLEKVSDMFAKVMSTYQFYIIQEHFKIL